MLIINLLLRLTNTLGTVRKKNPSLSFYTIINAIGKPAIEPRVRGQSDWLYLCTISDFKSSFFFFFFLFFFSLLMYSDDDRIQVLAQRFTWVRAGSDSMDKERYQQPSSQKTSSCSDHGFFSNYLKRSAWALTRASSLLMTSQAVVKAQ